LIELVAPSEIPLGQPFHVTFRSPTRVSGRLRLTKERDLVPFTLLREGRESVTGDSHRVRGKEGALVVKDWGEHAPGTELVLRFEGAKVWMKVV
jgi:hypothetical protein